MFTQGPKEESLTRGNLASLQLVFRYPETPNACRKHTSKTTSCLVSADEHLVMHWRRTPRPGPLLNHAHLTDVRRLQKAHLLFVADGTGADLSAVDAGLGVDPRTGLTAAPAATAATVLQLVRVTDSRLWPSTRTLIPYACAQRLRHRHLV